MSEQLVADDHSEEFELLAGLSALHLLEGDELATFEQHAARCRRCRLMVRLDRQALAGVSLVAPEMDPSPDFKQRLMRRAAAELADSVTTTAPEPPLPGPAPAPGPPTPAAGPATPEPGPLTPAAQSATPVPESPTPARAPAPGPGLSTPAPAREPIPLRLPPRVVPFWRRSTWITALAAVLVLGLVSVGAYSYQNQPVATYPLGGSASGHASVVVRRSGAAELDLQGVPDPPPGFVYEAWIIPDGKSPIAAGIAATGTATLSLPGDVRGTTVAITQEHGRVDAPTTTPLMAAVVQS